jgi:MipA family protein
MTLSALRHLVFAAALFPAVAFAQDASDAPPRDSVTIGVGVASVPRFEGASESTIIPAAAIRGTVSGISFSTVGTGLYVDLVRPRAATGIDFILGPVAHATLNRTSRKRTRDPQINALGKLDVAVELGGDIGISRTGVFTSDFDTLSFDVAVTHDVTGTHDSLIVTPTFAYATPLSTKLYVGASVSANYVGKGYGRTYFGVDGAQSLASALPVYDPGSGLKDINFGLLGNLSLSGDLRRGLSLFALGNYARLLGDFGRSPVVRDRGQWFGGVGLAYTF